MAEPTLDQQPNSKTLKVSGERKTGSIVKKLNYNPVENPNGFLSEVPDLGESHPYIDDLFFYDADWQPMSGKFGNLILNYSWIQNGAIKTELRASTIEAPLSNNENYTLSWDHNLLVFTGEDTTVPTWWDSIKTIDEFEANNTDGKYTIKTNVNSINSNDYTIVAGRKFNQNTYKKPTISVLEIVYWADEENAINETKTVGELIPPSNTYGRDEDPALRWLKVAAPVTREGGYWVVKNQYLYNDSDDPFAEGTKGWPFDIYGL